MGIQDDLNNLESQARAMDTQITRLTVDARTEAENARKQVEETYRQQIESLKATKNQLQQRITQMKLSHSK